MQQYRSHIGSLDALRGVAALAVVLYHMSTHTALGPTPPRSYLAVDFFFVLSGFVLARTYESRLKSRMSVIDFARIRLIRLYPLIALGMLLGFAAKTAAYVFFPAAESQISSLSVIVEALLFGLFLIPNKGMYGPPNDDMFQLDSPVWSLMFEFWANIIYASVVRLLTLPILRLVIASGAIAVGLSALIKQDLNGGYSLATIGIGLARVWYSFFAGVLIHRMLPREMEARIPRVSVFVLAGVLVLTLIPSTLLVGVWFEVVVVLVIYPMIVILGISDTVSSRWRPIALTAGALSYPLYILHWPTVNHFSHFHGLQGARLDALLVFGLLCALFLSYVANRFYDEPLRKWLNAKIAPVFASQNARQ